MAQAIGESIGYCLIPLILLLGSAILISRFSTAAKVIFVIGTILLVYECIVASSIYQNTYVWFVGILGWSIGFILYRYAGVRKGKNQSVQEPQKDFQSQGNSISRCAEEKERTVSATLSSVQNNTNGNDDNEINYCFKCGTKIRSGAYYCTKCGSKVRED